MYALIRVTGAVQGIGYRPFVAELATKYELKGEVKNLGGIVEIVVCGDEDHISLFADELRSSSPSGSIVINVSLEYLEGNEPEGLKDYSGFRIVESSEKFDKSYLAVFPPDIGICDECMDEMEDKTDRRYDYPLISCASCGPRFSILKKLPYDRITTTMGVYSMCPECAKEYQKGRRRHAQTISCHNCGPQLIFDSFCDDTAGSDERPVIKDTNDESIVCNKTDGDAIDRAISIIKNGGIIGIKGIGGYQLAADPYNYESVKRLRDIKGREQKPFAVMFSEIAKIRRLCKVSAKEEELLISSARPIVLLDKKVCDFADNVCGDSRQIGAFLPSSGVHRLLTAKTGPLIVTSGNISGEPMIVSDDAFKEKFADKIDGILWYKRDILRPLDDSVIQIFRNSEGVEEPRFIRRARGYVPLPLFLQEPMESRVFFEAFGADLKNTFSIGYGDRIITSQFLGDMEDYGVLKLQTRELDDFNGIFRTQNLDADKKIVISDMHPGYHSTELAKDAYKSCDFEDKKFVQIQHHHAHIGSVMAEYGLNKCIGVAFDGTGYGTDKTIWGSEFLICHGGSFEKVCSLKSVRIVGRDEGMKNAALSAACYLMEAGMEVPEDILSADDKALIRAALMNNINAFPNSGMGRLFDAVSCILGLCSYNSYEGECAIRLQNAAEQYIEKQYTNQNEEQNLYNCIDLALANEDIPDLHLKADDGLKEIDTAQMLLNLMDLRNSEDVGKCALSFHMAIARVVRDTAIGIRQKSGLKDVCLSGGVFANRLLLYLCDKFLKDEGFMVYYNRILPANDGGISAGQIYLADLMLKTNDQDL